MTAAAAAAERSGGCECRAVRYRFDPAFALKPYACHCRDCQTRGGGPCAVQIFVRTEGFAVTGETLSATRPRPDGTEVTRVVCPSCLIRLWSQNSKRPGVITLRAGTLDDSETVVPGMHIWTESRQAWVVIPDDVPAYARQPDTADEWLRHLTPVRVDPLKP